MQTTRKIKTCFWLITSSFGPNSQFFVITVQNYLFIILKLDCQAVLSFLHCGHRCTYTEGGDPPRKFFNTFQNKNPIKKTQIKTSDYWNLLYSLPGFSTSFHLWVIYGFIYWSNGGKCNECLPYIISFVLLLAVSENLFWPVLEGVINYVFLKIYEYPMLIITFFINKYKMFKNLYLGIVFNLKVCNSFFKINFV